MIPSRNFRFPWRQDNQFEVLVDSTEFFPRMIESINTARRFLLLEMYLVASGTVADRFIESLLSAAERGVKIYLLFDDFGSQHLEQRDRAKLDHVNIQLVYYNPLHSYNTLYNLYRIFLRGTNRALYRNHRKLLLVDGETAFVGGAGIIDAVESPRKPELRWRETMIRIQGPIVGDWQQLFTDSWNSSTDEQQVFPQLPAASFPAGQRGRVTVNEARRRKGVQRSLLRHVQRARTRIWFATAYFIPSWNLRRKLKYAARSGVDVRLLLPGSITDHPGARYASRRYYSRLLKSGIRIYEYTPRFLHAKTVLCDDWVSIGSCNYDRWNLQWNLEANQEVSDPALATAVGDVFRKDFAESIEYTWKNWQQRSWNTRTLEWFWRRMEILSLKIRNRRQR